MADLEALFAQVLDSHYKSSSYAPRRGVGMMGDKDRPGLWTCSCGAEGAVHFGQSVTKLHRRHLARELARAVDRAERTRS